MREGAVSPLGDLCAAQSVRAITAIQIVIPAPVIHQKISAISSAALPAGVSADCGPPQAEINTIALTARAETARSKRRFCG